MKALYLCLFISSLFFVFLPYVKAQKNYAAALDSTTVGTEAYFSAYEAFINYQLEETNANIDSLTDDLIKKAIAFHRPSFHAVGLYQKAKKLEKSNSYNEILVLLQQALSINEKGQHIRVSAEILTYSGIINAYASGKYDTGIPFIKQSNLICEEHGLEEILSFNYYYIGYLYRSVYQQQSANSDKQKTPEFQNYLVQAELSFKKALILAKKNQNQINDIQMQIVDLLINQKKHQEAVSLALSLLEKKSMKSSIYRLLIMLARAEFGLNHSNQAHKYIDDAIQLIQELEKVNELVYAYYTKFEFALEEKDYKTAFEYYEKKDMLKDSLFTEDQRMTFDELSLSYETEKKEQENLRLKQEQENLTTRNQWITLTALFFLLGLFGLAYLLYRNQKQNLLIQHQKLELEKLDETKSQFFNNVAHELRTPLTLISGPLQSILKRKDTTPQSQMDLQLMQRNTKRLLNLVGEILNLARMEQQQLQLQETSIEFYGFIQRLVTAFESAAHYNNIDLQLNHSSQASLYIELDVQKFEKIINNLLSNAFKFTPQKGQITLHVTELAENLQIEIKDTGRGIAAEDVAYIFDRYFQTKKNDQTLEGGTGIGLALCKEYITLFGGQISVQSQLNEGSTFTLIFPKKLSTEQPNQPESIENTSKILPEELTLTAVISVKKQERINILIVEDNRDMRFYIQSILGTAYHCHMAKNGQVAWKLLSDPKHTFKPDLIISDVMMPYMDGFSLLEKIKASETWRSTPVVMLTARAAREDRMRGLTFGIDDYITKPFDGEELLIRINNLLQNYFARKQPYATVLEKDAVLLPEKVQFDPVSAADLVWMEEVAEHIKLDIGHTHFSLIVLAGKMAISERHLGRRIKQITGMNAGKYIKEIKLQRARFLLEEKVYLSVAEVGYAVGFNTPSYFSKIYKARFGKLPSEYID